MNHQHDADKEICNKEIYLQFNQICEAFEYIHIKAADMITRQISKVVGGKLHQLHRQLHKILTHTKH